MPLGSGLTFLVPATGFVELLRPGVAFEHPEHGLLETFFSKGCQGLSHEQATQASPPGSGVQVDGEDLSHAVVKVPRGGPRCGKAEELPTTIHHQEAVPGT